MDTQTIVIGAGPAGLAIGACLQRAGVSSLLLEQSDQVGSAWRHHYDRLHLHTDKASSALPYVPFPPGYPRYPSRQQVIDYLEAYARRFDLDIRFGHRVTSARRDAGRWLVETQSGQFTAPSLVIAAGYNCEPYLPSWPGQNDFKGELLHSSLYRNGRPYRGQRVLVVGYGNSGGEIAIDLFESGAQPALAVRGPVNVVPRELFGIPILTVAGLERWLPPSLADALNAPILDIALGGVRRAGLRYLPYGPLAGVASHGRVPLIDVGTIRLLRRQKIALYPGLERFTEKGVVFAGGRQADFEAVILATGYRARVDSFLGAAPELLDADGMPHISGREAPVAGLYFCGYALSPAGMLNQIAREARAISAAIADKQTAARPA